MKVKAISRLIFGLAVTGAILLSIRPSFGQSTDSLEQRLKKQEIRAIKEAGENGRTDLIPLLEDLHAKSSPFYDATRPWSQQALAKLGVRKYLDEIVQELVDPTNTVLFAAEVQGRGNYGPELAQFVAKMDVQSDAFDKLAYINDPSTIKYIAPFLYDTALRDPERKRGRTQLMTSNADSAMHTLVRMGVAAPPVPPGTGYEQACLLWQQWWEQHKDYYEKLEFGKPAPPEVTTNTVARPVSAAPKTPQPALAKPSAVPAAAAPERDRTPWLIGIVVALAALLGGAVLWRARRR